MDKNLRRFMEQKFKSTARIVDERTVEVVAPDGTAYTVIRGVGKLINEDTQRYELHLIEWIFDRNYSEDKELMFNSIWRDSFVNGIAFRGLSSTDGKDERVRIGLRIRQIREERGIEARELAKLARIDAASLSRIENGKCSVGIDILSRIASAVGKKVDFTEI